MSTRRIQRRIALVSSSFAPHVGGVEEHVRHVAHELAELGQTVEVWTVDRGERPAGRAVDGVTVRYLPTPLPARSARALMSFARDSPSAWGRWVRAYRTFRPDVIHVQCFGPNGLYALALHHRFRTPMVVSSHGETFADDHGVFDGSELLRWGLRRALSKASSVTGCSQFVLDHLTDNYGLTGGTVVPNGVEMRVGAGGRQLPEQPYVFAVGRLGKPKGFDLLIAAYAASSLPGKGVRLIIGGDGSERHALVQQRRELGLESVVDLPGQLSADEVAAMMAGACVVAVPSRIEAFGIVVLEAWRSGAPLIMTNRGGGPGLVHDGIDGILVDPNDTGGLGKALDRIYTDRAMALRLSQAGRERVRAFTWEATATSYDQLYSAIREGSGNLR